MKTLVKLAVILAVVGSNILKADDSTSQKVSTSAILMGDATPTMRVITQGEFDGTDPIIIKLNETFIIPLHYERHILANTITTFFGPEDCSVVEVIPGGLNWSNNGMVLDVNLICTGKQLGQTNVHFGEVGQLDQKFNIQVVE